MKESRNSKRLEAVKAIEAREKGLGVRPLEPLVELGILGRIDQQVAIALTRRVGESDPFVLLGVAAASSAVRGGHVCADLGALPEQMVSVERDGERWAIDWPEPMLWVERLQQSKLVGWNPDGDGHPLILDGNRRLYLARYASYEASLARKLSLLAASAQNPPAESTWSRPARPGLLPFSPAEALARLFPSGSLGFGDDGRQRRAAELALERRLVIISGGPGTGKTYTVAKILAVLLERAIAEGRPVPRVLLLAPTGKAARRLKESISSTIDAMDTASQVKREIPREASTIHRSLGFRPDAASSFSHHRDNPLPADIVLVDEASMVDLALMAKLFDAISPEAQVILLGDKDQLASVEAGAILGDLWEASGALVHYPETSLAALPDSPPPVVGNALGGCLIELIQSRRFGPESGIGRLARSINRGSLEDTMAALAARRDVTWIDPERESRTVGSRSTPSRQIEDWLEELLGPDWIATFPGPASANVEERLKALQRFVVLCAVRQGPLGVASINQLAERVLSRRGLVRLDGEWYTGRPILIVSNDARLGLFNGDMGVIRLNPKTQAAEACFLDAEGALRVFAPGQLPAHETVFSTSIHKSQGSEFDKVAVVLPNEPSPLLTRELLYTAVTRARSEVVLIARRRVIEHAVKNRVRRQSGLAARLRERDRGCEAQVACEEPAILPPSSRPPHST